MWPLQLNAGLLRVLVKVLQKFSQETMSSLVTRQNVENASFANQGRQISVEKYVLLLELEL